MPKRIQEHPGVDLWLEEKGYYRKDTPKDPTCLFRAISEQVYHAQYYHIKVRKECIAFMREKKHLFEESITGYEHYLDQMSCFTEWGGMTEIRAMSLLYKKNVIIFNGQKQTIENITNDFDEDLLLCYTPPKQYESVLSSLYVKKAAYCQSLVYGVLYECVFNMTGITHTADRMLHDRNSTFRHDRFFQKGNLEIRDQLTADLYNRIENNCVNADEMQFDSKGIPPISYKVAKALSPDIYRNTDFDTWHEIKREVKYGGWNRHNSNELQIGGKCLINLNYLIDQDKSNNNLLQPSTSGTSNKNTRPKLKEDKSFYFGYIQKMGTKEDPAFVFVEELGEIRVVPYAALKPFPLARKNRQTNVVSYNRRNISMDAGRRWKKTYNSTLKKKKDNVNVANTVTNTANKNNSDSSSINKSTDKVDFKNDVQNGETSKTVQDQTAENKTTSETVNNTPPPVVTHEDPQPLKTNKNELKTNNAVQEISEERKKTSTTPVFTKHNVDSGFANKSAKFGGFHNNHDDSRQIPYSKGKMINENYCPPNINSQMNLMANPDLFYVFADGSSCPVFQFLPRNCDDFEQANHFFSSRFAYNSGMEYSRANQTWNYGNMAFGPGQYNVLPLEGAPNLGMNNGPCMPDEMVGRLVNGMQNCSFTCNETTGCNVDGKDVGSAEPIVYKAPFSPYINGVQNTKHPRQGTPKNLSGRDLSYHQSSDKKYNGIHNKGGKGNKTRYQQNNRDTPTYAQPWNHHGAVPSVANDARIINHMQQQPQHLDPIMQHHQHQHQQLAANSVNTCVPYVPPSNNVIFYSNDVGAAETCCNPYYMNGLVPVACFPPGTASYHDAPENGGTTVSPPLYPPHIFPQHTETYPPIPSYPTTMFPSSAYPLAPPQMQLPPAIQQQPQPQLPPPPPPSASASLPPPPPQPALPPPTANMQEHWYPMVGPPPLHYMQYIAPPTPVITEQSCNGQTAGSSV